MTWVVDIRVRLGDFELRVEVAGNSRPTAIIGPNGSGKTTLLRAIAGAHPDTEGRIAVGDRVLSDSARGIRLAPEARGVGYVPQGFGLFPHLTALDNVAFGLTARAPRTKPEERRRRALALLRDLDCDSVAGRRPNALSGGEQQRVALARALLVDPSLLLLDEPLSTLDPASRGRLRGFLARHLNALGAPAIVVTHDCRDVDALEAVVVALEGGRVVQQGSLATLRDSPATAFVAAFTRGA